jgi:uncharacterized membrane protein YraQ (UPF0718 family)
MLLVIPPIFILLGLLDVWVPKEKVKFMGEGSGLKGVLLAIFLDPPQPVHYMVHSLSPQY